MLVHTTSYSTINTTQRNFFDSKHRLYACTCQIPRFHSSLRSFRNPTTSLPRFHSLLCSFHGERSDVDQLTLWRDDLERRKRAALIVNLKRVKEANELMAQFAEMPDHRAQRPNGVRPISTLTLFFPCSHLLRRH